MNEQVKAWLLDKLDDWADTYDDEEREGNSAVRIEEKLRAGRELTKGDLEEALFHLWQISFGEGD